jgi:hypothetical protein
MLVNPISFRLSVSFFWNSTWSLYKNNNYKYLFSSDLVFFEFFMFFFRKTMNFRSLDYYPSHLRLYRLQDKTIVNLYYHMSKSEHFFDEIDLIYKGSQKRVIIKKKLLRVRKNTNNLSPLSYKKINFFYLLQNSIKFINKNLKKIIFFKFLWLKKNNNFLKTSLDTTMKLKWKSLKENLMKKFNFFNDNNNWSFIIKFLKKYYYKMSKNYIYFFIKNQDLILNLKLKKINQFKYFIESDETIMDKLINLKFSKVTKNVVNENKIKDKLYENFLESFDLILNQKDLNQKIFQNLNTKKIYIKIYGNYKKFYKRYDLQNQISIKKLFQRNTIEKLMNVFWLKKIKKNRVVYNINNINIVGLKKKRIKKFFKGVKTLYKSEFKLINDLNKQLSNKTNLKNFNNKITSNKIISNDITSNKITSNKITSNDIKLKKNKKNKLKKLNSMKKFSKINSVIKKVKKVFYKIDSYKKIDKIRAEIFKIKNIVNKDNILYKKSKNNFDFLYKINFLKFIYNQKFWIFNMYYYFLSKFLKNLSGKIFKKFFKKIELNIFKINIHSIRADIISKYITSSFKHNYSIYETMRPVLVDLKDRMKKKKVAGFKITVSGRFKRAQRATYWWRKDGQLLTGTQTAAIDYSNSLHKTKYGVCSVCVWLAPGPRGLGSLVHEFPSFNPFFFISKKNKFFNSNYYLLKRNDLFFFNIKKNFQKLSYNLQKNYLKGLIMYLLYKYLYINILFKNILLINNFGKMHKILKRIILPQYCIYKISLENYLQKNYIKIIPFIQIKLLKRINLRNSYKVSFLNKSKFVHLDTFKYRIFI